MIALVVSGGPVPVPAQWPAQIPLNDNLVNMFLSNKLQNKNAVRKQTTEKIMQIADKKWPPAGIDASVSPPPTPGIFIYFCIYSKELAIKDAQELQTPLTCK